MITWLVHDGIINKVISSDTKLSYCSKNAAKVFEFMDIEQWR